MNRHYDRYLVRKYEPLYKDRFSPMTHTAMCWGFEVGDGWFHIINELSRMLCHEWLRAQDVYERVKDREGLPMFGTTVSQHNPIVTKAMIEKYKSEVDEAYKNTPIATQVKEKYGTLRFYINGGTDVHYAYIDMATAMSAVTCEVCGKRGKQSYGGWVVTRCKEHWDY
jgi:hypothetical protein